MTDIEESRLSSSIKIEHPGPESYNTMAIKLWSILKHVYVELSEGFDWIYICGDDTFLMTEHLRDYLAKLSQGSKDENAMYVGRRFQYGPTRTSWRHGLVFNSGAGYALNSKALKLWYEACGDSRETYERAKSMEDVVMAECLRKFHVIPLDTRDKSGAERFHAFTPSQAARLRFSVYVLSFERLSSVYRASFEREAREYHLCFRVHRKRENITCNHTNIQHSQI